MIVGVLQARMSSRRLPSKVLADLAGAPMLGRQVERLRRCRSMDRLVLATSTDASDDPLVALADELALPVQRGSLDDVLDRCRQAAAAHDAGHMVRFTGDCPLADPAVIDRCVEQHLAAGNDYTSNVHPPTWPDGLDVEVVRREALEQAWSEATSTAEREHVTPFIHQRPQRFRLGNLAAPRDLSALRWTVDEVEDLAFVRAVYAALYPQHPAFTVDDVLALLDRSPELAAINRHHERNAGAKPDNA